MSNLSAFDGADSPVSQNVDVDPEFYLDDTFAVFKVGRTLFRLPVYKLKRESVFFARLFANESLGSPDSPLALPGNVQVEAAEFRNLLQMLFPRENNPAPDFDKAQWYSVLKLSTLWKFKDFRTRAIKNLEGSKSQLTSMEMILWGREFFISDSIRQGYLLVMERKETIEMAEATALGWETTVKLFQLRELYREWRPRAQIAPVAVFRFAPPSQSPQQGPDTAVDHEGLRAQVDAAFAFEFAKISLKENAF